MDNMLLIVDDEPNILNSLKRSLSLAGYTVVTANSGEEGLQILASKNIPVIISDQRMPNMTGAEFFMTVKSRYPSTIRIMLSAYADFDTISEALKNGDVHKILPKPWSEEYLMTDLTLAFEVHALKARVQALIRPL